RLQGASVLHLEQSITGLLQSFALSVLITRDVREPDIYPPMGVANRSPALKVSSNSGPVNAPISFFAEAALSHDTSVPSTNPTAAILSFFSSSMSLHRFLASIELLTSECFVDDMSFFSPPEYSYISSSL